MNISENTVLITGGGSGIGLSLAEAFVEKGNRVIICGRREERLEDARRRFPQIESYRCDISKPEEREGLLQWIQENHPDLNILINNAGIQIPFHAGNPQMNFSLIQREIETNLSAPVHLAHLFLPLLKEHSRSAIMNVSSGLAFSPLALFPVYCATKAALHSFSMSLRHQLSGTTVKVFEIIPPMVSTELKGEGTLSDGIPPHIVADETLSAMAADQYEIVVGEAKNLRERGEAMFPFMNKKPD